MSLQAVQDAMVYKLKVSFCFFFFLLFFGEFFLVLDCSSAN